MAAVAGRAPPAEAHAVRTRAALAALHWADLIAPWSSVAGAMGSGQARLGGGSSVREARQAPRPDARSQPWSRSGLRPLPTEPVSGLQRRTDAEELAGPSVAAASRRGGVGGHSVSLGRARRAGSGPEAPCPAGRDRKSTRLNSSHGYISYAVFCLKKKKKKR